MNGMTKEALGQEKFGYIQFFGEQDAVELMERDGQSTRSLFLSDDEEQWGKSVGSIGATRRWWEEGRVAPLPAWLGRALADERSKRLMAGGFTGPLNWSRAAMSGVNDRDFEAIEAGMDRIDDVPVLFVESGQDDGALLGNWQVQATKSFCRDVRVKRVGAGHWMLLQAPEEVSEALGEFLESIENAKESTGD